MTTSTIDTSIPKFHASILSATLRENFLAAANDIDNLYALIAAASGIGLTPVRSIYTGSTDTALITDSAINWMSSDLSEKTQTIIGGIRSLSVSDGVGNADIYGVTLVGDTNGIVPITIGGHSSITFSDSRFNVGLAYDGVSNYIIQSYYNGSLSIAGPNYLLAPDGSILLDPDGNPLLAS